MSSAPSFGRVFLLTVALVGAWVPAAVIASPGSRSADATPEEPTGIHSVADEAPRASVAPVARAV